jgi:tRNA pseudouridine38-40 synthase
VPRLVLTVAYDGTDFAGSQIQPGARTVQGELDAAIARVGGVRPVTRFAGRTDRGVHAAGQVVGLDDPRPEWPGWRVAKALNAVLPPDLAVVRAERAADGFDARFDARWREYRYRVWFGGPAPLVCRTVWRATGGADAGAMREAAALLLGSHDFAAFAGGGEGVPWSERRRRPRGTARTLFASDVREMVPWWGPVADGRLVEYRVVGDGFLPQMVRAIVAALVEVGRGRRPPAWVGEVLAARDRRAGGGLAGPNGLTLWRVGYAPWDPASDEEAAGRFEPDEERRPAARA